MKLIPQASNGPKQTKLYYLVMDGKQEKQDLLCIIISTQHTDRQIGMCICIYIPIYIDDDQSVILV